MNAKRKSFTKDALLKLAPGEVITDGGYGGYGSGTLLARAAKDGEVTVALKISVGGKQLKREVAKGMTGYFAAGGSLGKLRRRAYEIAEEARSRGRRGGVAQRGNGNVPTTIGELGTIFLERRQGGALRSFKPLVNPSDARKAIERASAFWGNMPVTGLDNREGDAFLDYVIADARKASKRRENGGKVGGRVGGKHPGHETARIAKGAIRNVLKFAAAEYGLPVRIDIFDATKLEINPPKGDESVMTAEECDRFHEALRSFVASRGGRGRTGRHLSEAIETADLITLCYLAAGRMNEWKSARWSEIDIEAETPTWTIGEGDRKQGTKHLQVLTTDAVAILRGVWRRRTTRQGREPRDGDYVFPSRRSKSGHVTSYARAFATILEMSGVNDHRSPENKITPHRAVRASRITELRDVEGWTAKQVADYIGATEQIIEARYYREQDKLKKQAAMVATLKSRRAV